MIVKGCVVALAVAVLTGRAWADGATVDYGRGERLRAATRDKVASPIILAYWFHGGDRFWYCNHLGDDRHEFILVDAVAGKRGPAFDHARVAAALSQKLGHAVTADRLPIYSLDFPNATTVRLFGEGKAWSCDLRSYALTAINANPPDFDGLDAARMVRPSPRTGPDTTIHFENRTKVPVTLVWIGGDGTRTKYATLPPGGTQDQHTFGGHVWLAQGPDGSNLGVFEASDSPAVAIIDGAVRTKQPPAVKRPRPQRPSSEGRSPDDFKLAFIRNFNVWIRGASGAPVPLTKDGTAEDAYGDLFWSPDSTHLVALKTRAAQEHKVYLVESSPSDQIQPKLHPIDYLKPGDRIAQTKPHLFDIAAMKEIPISDTLFPNPWALEDVRWDADSRRFTFYYNQRGHQVLRIIAVDARTGAAKAVVDEQSKTFIDYAGKHYVYYLDATHEILWMSERDGWNHLYLYDALTGKVKNQVTKGPWVVRGVTRVDTEKRQIWFRAGGIHPDQDPYYMHFCRVNFDGSGLTQLTQGDGYHALDYSRDGRFYIDSYSRVDMPPVNELRRATDGSLICPLEKADASALLATGWTMPERFTAPGRDGRTPIYGVIWRPSHFDPAARYPVIEDIYAGPQDSFTPKSWAVFHGQQELAELGFIVVQMDGMGTSNRSKAFHDVCWKNLGDAGFPDRIAWIKAAAAKYPYMDLTRVGIYGTSAGGQNALRALEAHGDFYKAAVADSGCHDNRMDKIWWNELWMGWPVGPEYAEQSNVTHAAAVRGKLLLMAGEMDNNVDPSSTMQVANALIKAKIDFDMLIVPGAGHGVAGTPYGKRKMFEFFVRTLK